MKTPSIIAGIGGILVIGGLYWHFAGYSLVYSEYDATKRAEEIVDDGLPVETCLRIKTIVPTYPPAGSFRRTCIRKYAELKKDPLACKFLSGSYALNCVGAAKKIHDSCIMDNGKSTWDTGEESYKSCADTGKQRTQDAAACCLIARTAFVHSENDCASLSGKTEYFNECLTVLAFKKRDKSFCSQISEANSKAVCIAQVEVILEDPKACEGCKIRVNTLKEFE